MKKISIVTISFNQARYLEEAINSILNQKYNNLEYIIVDPGSTDGSREIINDYKDRISKIIFKVDAGPAEGLNNGFAEATGDIFGYLNADDLLLPGTLNRVSNVFQNNPNLDVISAHGYNIDQEGKLAKKIFSHHFDIKHYLYENCILVQQSTFFKSSIFRLVGGFNANNHIAWDGELMVDFFNTGANFKVTRGFWSGFRVYDQSISGGSDYFGKLNADYLRLRQKYDFPEIGPHKKKILWFMNWIRQPLTLLRRIYSAFESVLNVY